MSNRPGSYFHLHLVSDATGETLITVARAAAAQYVTVTPIEHIYPLVRSQRQLDRVLNEVEATWDEKGAVCISHRRYEHANPTVRNMFIVTMKPPSGADAPAYKLKYGTWGFDVIAMDTKTQPGDDFSQRHQLEVVPLACPVRPRRRHRFILPTAA